jgi:hypothetical protein
VLKARVADLLLEGPKSVRELAQVSGFNEDQLAKILRNLAIKHCFRAGLWFDLRCAVARRS